VRIERQTVGALDAAEHALPFLSKHSKARVCGIDVQAREFSSAQKSAISWSGSTIRCLSSGACQNHERRKPSALSAATRGEIARTIRKPLSIATLRTFSREMPAIHAARVTDECA
jgi:hypothetical protein